MPDSDYTTHSSPPVPGLAVRISRIQVISISTALTLCGVVLLVVLAVILLKWLIYSETCPLMVCSGLAIFASLFIGCAVTMLRALKEAFNNRSIPATLAVIVWLGIWLLLSGIPIFGGMLVWFHDPDAIVLKESWGMITVSLIIFIYVSMAIYGQVIWLRQLREWLNEI